MSEQPKCEHCGSTDIQYKEMKKSSHNVLDITEDRIRIGKARDEDVTDNDFICGYCHRLQPALDKYEKDFLL